MKKIILGIAFACFVAFGTFGIQSAVASVDNMEIVKLQLDDDPDKNKKAKANKDGKKDCKKSCDKSKTKCCPDAEAKCKSESKKCDKKCDDKKTTGKEGGDRK